MFSLHRSRFHYLVVVGLLLWSLITPLTAVTVQADGSRDGTTNGGKRVLTEWRTGKTAGVYRRTFMRVFAKAGETILMGSSAMGVGSGDIVLFQENQVSDSQIDHNVLNGIPPTFKCSTNPGTANGRGKLTTRAQEQAGPTPAVGGYEPCSYSVTATGTYWVAFYGPSGPLSDVDGNAGTIDAPNIGTGQNSGVSMWDITVRRADGTNVAGRVFTDYLAQISGGNGDTYRIYSTIYAVTEDGFIYQVDYHGLDPFGFIAYGNRVGFLDPDGKTPLYHDLISNNADLSSPLGGVTAAHASARLFFRYPSADLPVNILPIPVMPSITNVAFTGSSSGNNALSTKGGVFTYTGNIGGITQIVISQDKTSPIASVNFDPNLATNRVIYSQSFAGSNTIKWDGYDNSGQAFPVGNGYRYQVTFHAGEYHFPMLDVENNMLGGPTITMLNPLNGQCPLNTCRQAFYDDRGYKVSTGINVGTPGQILPGINPPSISASSLMAGFDSATDQRAYGNDSANGFGQMKGLDLWTYYPIAPISAPLNVVALPNQDLSVVSSHADYFDIKNLGGSFNLVVTGAGQDRIKDTVTLTDTLPGGLIPASFSSTDGSWRCTFSGQIVTCTHPNGGNGLSFGESLPTLTINVNVANSAAPRVTNKISISNVHDDNPANDTYLDPVNINSADLGLSISASSLNPSERDVITYTITASNLGPSSTTSAQIKDLLPAGLTLVSHSENLGSYDQTSGVWSFGTLPNAVSATLTLQARVNTGTAGTAITNSVTSQASQPYDYVAGNNSASVTVNVKPTVLTGTVSDINTGLPLANVTVQAVYSSIQPYSAVTGADGRYTITGLPAGTPTIKVNAAGYEAFSQSFAVTSGIVNTDDIALRSADLSVTLSDNKIATFAGDNLVYQVNVSNSGVVMANGVVITAALPAYLRYVGDDSGVTPQSLGGNVYRWTLPGALNQNSGKTFNLVTSVDNPLDLAVSQLSTTVSVTTSSPEANTTNNQQSDTDTILIRPNLGITITNGKPRAQAGESLTYSLVYGNSGNTASTGVVVKADIPAGLNNIIPSNGGIYDPTARTITWTIGSLAIGEQGSRTFTAQVDSSFSPGSVINVPARITGGALEVDLDTSNNSAAAVSTLVRPELILDKSLTGPARLETPLTIALRYKNTSPVSAEAVTITDLLPVGASLVAGSCSPACSINGNQVAWAIGSVPAGASGTGTLTYQINLTAASGGGSKAAPGFTPQSGGGSLTVVSDPSQTTLKSLWTGSNPSGPANWQANPRSVMFDDAAWSSPLALTRETDWLVPGSGLLPAQWIAANNANQSDLNYSFFRQKMCVPLNAAGLSGTLNLAGDDRSDIYLNGIYLTSQNNAQTTSSITIGSAVQPGSNLLAIRLLNALQGGHSQYGGADHAGLVFNLNAQWTGYQPFTSVEKVVLLGQTSTFQIDPQSLGGQAPFTYHFDFGDGTAQDSSSTTVLHSYAAAGVYTAVVSVQDNAGCTATDTMSVVVLPTDNNLVLSSSTAAYSSTTGLVYTTGSGTGIDLPLADLALSMVSSPNPATAGQPLTYSLHVTNRGPRRLTSLTLNDVLPTALLAPVYTPSAGTFNATTGVWSGISLGSGESLDLSISGQVDPFARGTINHSASIASVQASETNLVDNTAADANAPLGQADISVTAVGTPTRYKPNDTVTYTVTITNNGPSGVSSLHFQNVLPSQAVNPVYTPSAGSYNPVTGNWDGLALKSGDQVTMTVTGLLQPPYSRSITYSVTVNPLGVTDPVPGNNTASVEIPSDPTAVNLTSATATWQRGNGVLLTWGTAQEMNVIGFNIYRRENNRGEWVLINADLIPTHSPGLPFGSRYEWRDLTAVKDVSYTYRIEELDVAGLVDDTTEITVFTSFLNDRYFLPFITN